MHRLLLPADYVHMPWKDGGGRTTEIFSHPPGSTIKSFDWRISIADVAADGPFSLFPGVDRTIVMIAGAGIRLEGEGHAVDLCVPFEPYAFSGDIGINCTLMGGPVRDFNLMLRRGRTQGTMSVVRGEGVRIPPARYRVCYAAAGVLEGLLPGHPPLTLAAEHALIVEDDGAGASGSIALNPLSGDAVALVAAIEVGQ